MSDYRVDTPERIEVSYDVAGLGSRYLAALIDVTIQTVAMVVVFFGGVLGVGVLLSSFNVDVQEVAGRIAFPLALVATFVVLWGYHVFFEMVWHGQSPGKRRLGLRVIKDGGHPISLADSLIRNVVRIVDFLPIYYTIGAMVMFFDRRSRRLGDLAAGTVVVKERRDAALSALDPLTTSDPGVDAGQRITGLRALTSADRAVVDDYLRRRAELTPDAADTLATLLAESLAAKMGHDLAGERPSQFLARLTLQLHR